MMNTTEAKWRGLIAEQERSGQTVREFSAGRGIAAGTLFWWRSELRRRSKRLVPVAVVDDGGAMGGRGSAAPCFEISLDDAITVRVPTSFDEEELRRLLRALRC
ncbi:MAG: hypothetical protein K8J09_17500 [Planctomycetes bacterium]|nr:hypothetical protein [Planctomycetota bacterium]MCC7399846.1 hypothetical protein [Planctomycetota bacterium]